MISEEGLQRGVGYRLGFGGIQGMLDMGRKGLKDVPRFPVYGTLWGTETKQDVWRSGAVCDLGARGDVGEVGPFVT